jgi:hypothetical protein
MPKALSVLGISLLISGGALIFLRRFGVVHTFPMAGSLLMLLGYGLWRLSRSVGSS